MQAEFALRDAVDVAGEMAGNAMEVVGEPGRRRGAGPRILRGNPQREKVTEAIAERWEQQVDRRIVLQFVSRLGHRGERRPGEDIEFCVDRDTTRCSDTVSVPAARPP